MTSGLALTFPFTFTTVSLEIDSIFEKSSDFDFLNWISMVSEKKKNSLSKDESINESLRKTSWTTPDLSLIGKKIKESPSLLKMWSSKEISMHSKKMIIIITLVLKPNHSRQLPLQHSPSSILHNNEF